MAIMHIIRDGVVEELEYSSPSRMIQLDVWIDWLAQQPGMQRFRTLSSNIAVSQNAVCAAEPAAIRTIQYRSGGDADTTLFRLRIPPVLWIYRSGNVYLYAVESPQLSLATQLFHIPTPNVHPDGKICWGAGAPNLLHMSQRFWETPFNGDLQSPYVAHDNSPYRSLDEWQAWTADPAAWPPATMLLLYMTLGAKLAEWESL